MLEILKNLSDCTGKPFGRDKVNKIITDFPEQYSDPYYHGVGIETIDKNNKTSFQDVYSLTMFYFDDVQKLILY